MTISPLLVGGGVGNPPSLNSKGVFGTNSALEFFNSSLYFLNWTASSSADYISTPTLTFCTWVYLTGDTGYASILGYNRAAYTSIRVTGGGWGADTINWCDTNSANGYLLLMYSYPLKNNGWHHLAFVKSGSNSSDYVLFIDGKKVATGLYSSSDYTQLRILDIGSDGFQGNTMFYGKLDDYLVCTDVLFTNDFSLPTKSVKAMFPNANYVVDLSTDGRKTNSDTDILKVY